MNSQCGSLQQVSLSVDLVGPESFGGWSLLLTIFLGISLPCSSSSRLSANLNENRIFFKIFDIQMHSIFTTKLFPFSICPSHPHSHSGPYPCSMTFHLKMKNVCFSIQIGNNLDFMSLDLIFRRIYIPYRFTVKFKPSKKI